MPLPPLSSIPPEVVSLDDYEALARERVEESAWAYLSGGAADELTLRENRAAFERLKLSPRILRDLAGANTRLELFGRSYAHPVFIAPTAFHRLFHPDGERATVLGASVMEACLTVSTSAGIPLEDISKAATVPPWFQLYVQADRGFTAELVKRVEAGGYAALVVTADAPLSGLRNREQRAGFRLPPGIEAVNLRGMKSLPLAEGVFGTPLLETAPTWKDLAWLRSLTSLPVILKGVLDPEDARIAVAEGFSGIVVSNHGGRTLDTVPAAIEVLPKIAEAVAWQLPILLDSGIRRGTDILKALALGASAVMVGRPVLHGLAVAGATGVAHVLKILRTELEIAMALTGRATLSSIDRSVVY
ncbi:alpha-hydroxy-acid oxidizing protein [Luteolibacter arcticus]|uniref:Alpha-hydroxy-acid oxidizing protein n=1 Tax=Luteolibacter arcticus TaxID=1581411 RepID=A0ABT3GI84_9BACT|nr:alpha-hydroxy acid oxidase [Luteolibacter arcticus]MCW1923206.1 alpha-hydroxy-acid oxidizing protein [Luteolibacter arcticus]